VKNLNILFVAHLALFSVAAAASQGSTLTYCVPAAKIDLNPLREINDGKEMAYIAALARPYISTHDGEKGILEAFDFSPDGKILTGRLQPQLKWPDGSIVTPEEVALAIRDELPFRPIGKRVKIEPNSTLEKSITYLDSRTFEIHFVSSIENLTGTLREALSSNSRQNRFWPMKKVGPTVMYLLKTSSSPMSPGHVEFELGGSKVEVVNGERCLNADFTLYPESLKNPEKYESIKNTHAQTLSMIMNTSRLDLKTRRQLGEWIRNSFTNLKDKPGIELASRHFGQSEPGFDESVNWPFSSGFPAELLHRKIRIAYEIPVVKAVLEEAANKEHLAFEFVQLPLLKSDIDVFVMSSAISNGRQVALQDVLKWSVVTEMLAAAPKTKSALQAIGKKSASTIPPDQRTLHSFEEASLVEQSVIPLARRYVVAYSRPNLPIVLTWSKVGEPLFSFREHSK
jgi:hypothetical protein